MSRALVMLMLLLVMLLVIMMTMLLVRVMRGVVGGGREVPLLAMIVV